MPAFTRSDLADLNVFMTIVRRRSFRQAALELGLTTSALSHSMKNLELRLGVKLLNRTSRRQSQPGLRQLIESIRALGL